MTGTPACPNIPSTLNPLSRGPRKAKGASEQRVNRQGSISLNVPLNSSQQKSLFVYQPKKHLKRVQAKDTC